MKQINSKSKKEANKTDKLRSEKKKRETKITIQNWKENMTIIYYEMLFRMITWIKHNKRYYNTIQQTVKNDNKLLK